MNPAYETALIYVVRLSCRLGPGLAGLVLLAVLLGCSWPGGPYTGIYDWQTWPRFSGRLAIDGPLPCYQEYDGSYGLSPTLILSVIPPWQTVPGGMEGSGMGVGMWSTDPARLVDQDFSLGMYQTGSFKSGEFELVLEVAHVGGQLADQFYDPLPGTAHHYFARGPKVSVTGPSIEYKDLQVEANTSGPGPYADVSGKARVFGNPLGPDGFQVVFAPRNPAPQFPNPPRYIWPVNSEGFEQAVWPYTAHDVSQGDYRLSFAGYRLRDPLDPLVLSDQPLAVGPDGVEGADLLLATAWETQRPYELGVIRGVVTVSGNRSFSEDIVIGARCTNIPPPDPYAYRDDRQFYAYWHILPAWLDTQGRESFKLGWLRDGEYELRVYMAKPDGSAGAVLAAYPGRITLAPGAREQDDINFEVSL